MKVRLLPYQNELREALKNSQVVVVEKSRRTGYSWAASWVAVGYAAKPKAQGGMNVYYMGYNLEMAREFIEYVGEAGTKLERGASAIGETLWQEPGRDEQQIKAFRVDFRNGRVVALPSRPRSLRGMQGLVILDEAAFHDDLAELLKAALALTVWGGKVLIISTHDGEDNPFNQLVQDCRAGRLPYTVLRCDFDRAVSEGLYKRVCERTGETWSRRAETAWREKIIRLYGDGAEEELFCIPSRGSGAWLPRNIIESCMDAIIPVVRWTPPSDDFVDWPVDQAADEVLSWCQLELQPLLDAIPSRLRSWVGEDFGRSGDLTDIWPVVRRPDLSLHTPFLLELRNAPFRVQKQILYFVLDHLPNLVGVALDARGNGQYLAEVTRQDYGGPDTVHEVMLTTGWYREHTPRVKAALEDRTVDLPQDEDILEDFRGIKMSKGVASPPERSVQGATGQRHCDSFVAFAMALYAEAVIEPGVGEWDVCTGGGSQTAGLMRGY
jgi:phage FluMu gp28-like protein